MGERMTCVFDYNIRSYDGNPFHADTPFGKPVITADADLSAELVALEARADEATRLLRECEEYFDQRADAEYFPDSPSPHPNEEMRFLCDIRAFLAQQEKG